MRMAISASILVALWGAAVSPGAEPKLVNAKRVFPKGNVRWKRPAQSGLWAMRLSPDGKCVLYSRPKGEPPLTPEGGPDWHKVQYDPVLRNLSTGKETVLPVGPIESGWRTVFTRFNLFDPTGGRLALLKIETGTRKVGEGAPVGRPKMKVLLYDVAAGKVTRTGIQGPTTFAKFNHAGNGLIVAQRSRGGYDLHTADLDKFKLRPLKIQGFPSGVCPTADVICLWLPPQRGPAPQPGERPTRGPQRLFLYDIKAGKEIANLPVHERNSSLDDCETQWTANGRYLYYYDVMEDPADTPSGGRRKRIKSITRIWDRVANKQAGTVSDAVAVGPGPTPTTMVLAKMTQPSSGGFDLHDAKSGTQSPLAGSGKRLVHAWGKKVIYAKRLPDGTEEAYVAELGPGKAKPGKAAETAE